MSCKPNSLIIAGVTLGSRLFIGTAGYPNQRIMVDAVEASGTELVTLSIRRISLDTARLRHRQPAEGLPLPAEHRRLRDRARRGADRRAGARGARHQLDQGRGDRRPRDALSRRRRNCWRRRGSWSTRGFVVLPYCNDDPVICRRLADLGAAAVMPMGSLIGSGMGVANPANLELICRRSPVPVIVDAGIGTASDAIIAMELGACGVLLNTAVAKSDDPVRMARSMRHAVEAGPARVSRRAHPAPRPRRAVEPAARTGRFVSGLPVAAAGRHRPASGAAAAGAGRCRGGFGRRAMDLVSRPRPGDRGAAEARVPAVRHRAGCGRTIVDRRRYRTRRGGRDQRRACARRAAIAEARRRLGPTALIGLSAHSVADVADAQASQAPTT